MPKTIWLQNDTYNRLDAFREKRETFDNVVDRLLLTREEICRLLDVLEGQIKFREWQREQLEETARAH